MNDLLLRTLRGETTERRPLWLMRQAGRFLPEYRALRAEHTFEELCADPALATEVTLMPIERFPLDAAIVFADLMTPAAAMGVDFRFDPGPVVERPIRTAADVRALRDPAPEEIAPEVYETLRRVKRELRGRATLIGFAGAPWSLGAYLVEGRGGRGGFPSCRAFLRAEPVLFGELMDRLARLATDYLIEQHRAGADVVQLFDSWAGLLPDAEWNTHVVPHVRSILAATRAAGIPTIYFPRGAPQLVAAHAALPCDGLGLCWLSDLAAVRAEIGDGIALQGNLDPTVLLAGPEVTQRATRSLLARMPARGHIVNLGHGILPATPLESVQALMETVHEEGPTT